MNLIKDFIVSAWDGFVRASYDLLGHSPETDRILKRTDTEAFQEDWEKIRSDFEHALGIVSKELEEKE